MDRAYIVVLYLRISVEDMDARNGMRDESNSIGNQRDLLRGFLQGMPEMEGSTVIELCDDGYSGTNFERPAVKELLEKARKKAIDCIMVKDFSRFGRDYLAVSDYVDQIFPFLGIRFISVNDGYDSAEYNGMTSSVDIAFKNVVYAYYSKDNSEKIRNGLRAKAQRGNYIGSFAPFGYQKDKKNKYHLVAEEKSAETVRRIFQMAAAGMGTVKIAYLLNTEHVPTPSMIKKEQGLIHKWWEGLGDEKLWHHRMIHIILRDERYLGKVTYGKWHRPEVGNPRTKMTAKDNWTVVPDCHEPLVTLEEFKAAQDMLIEHGERERKKEKHIFAGKIRCGICGYALCLDTRGSGKYRCITKYRTDKFHCKENHIMESDLKEVVWQAVRQFCRVLIDKQSNISKTPQLDKVSVLQKQIAAHQASLQSMDEQKADLYERMLDGEFDRQRYICKRESLTSRQDVVRQEEMALEERLLQMRKVEDNGLPEIETLQTYMQEEQLTREMVEAFVRCIYAYDRAQVHIEWLFDVRES